MKNLNFIFVIFSIIQGYTSILQPLFKEKVVGGVPISITDAPYQIMLMHKQFEKGYIFTCGGALISDSDVLTAAHCLFTNKTILDVRNIRIYAGSTNVTNLHTYGDALWMIQHPGYYANGTALFNDIGLVKLKKRFTLNQDIQPIRLRHRPVPMSASCKVSGWGSAHMKGEYSKHLMQVIIPLFDWNKCRVIFDILANGTICAGYIEGGKDACEGDSGGPLVCDGLLTGIVSYGKGCGEPGYPGVYTSVSYFSNWIKSARTPGTSKTTAPSFSFYLKLVNVIICIHYTIILKIECY